MGFGSLKSALVDILTNSNVLSLESRRPARNFGPNTGLGTPSFGASWPTERLQLKKRRFQRDSGQHLSVNQLGSVQLRKEGDLEVQIEPSLNPKP